MTEPICNPTITTCGPDPQSQAAPEPNMSVVEEQTVAPIEPTLALGGGGGSSGGCRPYLGGLPSPMFGAGSVEWVQIDTSHLSRVHCRANTRLPAHAVAKTQNYINGLQNVPGGENIAGMRKMQSSIVSGVPPATAPGWYIGDVSKPWPGRFAGHRSHQTGIGFDLTIPMENGGMTMKYVHSSRASKKYGWQFDWSRVAKRPPTLEEFEAQETTGAAILELEEDLWNKGFRLDWGSIMQFLKYSAPFCTFIFWYNPHITMARRLAIDMAKNNQDGWTLDLVGKLFGRGGTAHSGGRIRAASGERIVRHCHCPRSPTQKARMAARLGVETGWDNPQCHANHFHVRLKGAGKFDQRGRGNALDRGHDAELRQMKADWRARVAAGTAGVKPS